MQLKTLPNTCSMKELGDFSCYETLKDIKSFLKDRQVLDHDDNGTFVIIANVNIQLTLHLAKTLSRAGFKKIVSWKNRYGTTINTYFLNSIKRVSLV